MSNSLTRNAGLRLGPLVLETLVKHYFDRIKKENAQRSNFTTQLHQDELLYHEAFNIVKVRFGVNYLSASELRADCRASSRPRHSACTNPTANTRV